MSVTAFQVLANLASLSKRSAKTLPAQQAKAPRWSGVGFSCLGINFVIPMGQVKEMMEIPASTKLPGVKGWVVGLSNVRGRLLPLFDLAKFVGGQLNTQKKSHRVLVLETENLYSGLVVDRSFGMQHFINDTFGAYNQEVPEGFVKYITGAFSDDQGNQWGVFDLNLLAEDAEFVNAAI